MNYVNWKNTEDFKILSQHIINVKARELNSPFDIDVNHNFNFILKNFQMRCTLFIGPEHSAFHLYPVRQSKICTWKRHRVVKKPFQYFDKEMDVVLASYCSPELKNGAAIINDRFFSMLQFGNSITGPRSYSPVILYLIGSDKVRSDQSGKFWHYEGPSLGYETREKNGAATVLERILQALTKWDKCPFGIKDYSGYQSSRLVPESLAICEKEKEQQMYRNIFKLKEKV